MKKVLLMVLILVITLGGYAQTRPVCKGVTTKKQACKSTIVLPSGYCRVHNPNAVYCGFIKKDKKPCKMVVTSPNQRCKHHSKVVIKKTIDPRGLISVVYTEDGKTWALDFLTKHEFDSVFTKSSSYANN